MINPYFLVSPYPIRLIPCCSCRRMSCFCPWAVRFPTSRCCCEPVSCSDTRNCWSCECSCSWWAHTSQGFLHVPLKHRQLSGASSVMLQIAKMHSTQATFTETLHSEYHGGKQPTAIPEEQGRPGTCSRCTQSLKCLSYGLVGMVKLPFSISYHHFITTSFCPYLTSAPVFFIVKPSWTYHVSYDFP